MTPYRILSESLIRICSYLINFGKFKEKKDGFFLKESNVRKVSKYEFFSGPYFSEFGLNTEIYKERIRENTDQKKLRIWTLFRQRGFLYNDL